MINFNSRPHGGRRYGMTEKSGQQIFQLTPSRRATGARISKRLHHRYFNSRPHGGRHYVRRKQIKSKRYFNSRPHGGRRLLLMNMIGRKIFQLTPSRRATVAGVEGDKNVNISTHALTEGDYNFRIKSTGGKVFQLTPSRRATHVRNKLP